MDIEDDDNFCDVVHVEQRGTPAQQSLVVSTVHAAVETTPSFEANLQNGDTQTKRLRWKSVVSVQQHTKDGVSNSFPFLTD